MSSACADAAVVCTSKTQWHCHICKVDVPISHIQDHNESLQHYCNVSICQESLKRLNKHIVTINHVVNSSEDNVTYFCYICSAKVNNDEESFHVKSKQHIESEVKGRLLDNFRQLYIDGSNLKEKFYNQVKTNITDMLRLHNKETSLIKQDNSMETHNDDKINEQTDELQHILITKASYDNDHVEIIGKNVQQNDSLLPISGVYDTKTPEEDVKQTDNSKNRCDVCFVKIPNKNWKSHVNGMKHKLNLKEKKAEKDNILMHYQMQKSDNPTVLKCRICSIDVPDDTTSVETHLKSPEHITEYENLLKTHSIEKAKGRLSCLACGCYMVYKYELYHINSNKHKRALNFNELRIEDDYNKTVSILKNDDMKNRSYRLYEVTKVDDGFGLPGPSQSLTGNVLMETKQEDGESVTIDSSKCNTFGSKINYPDIDSFSTDDDEDAPVNVVMPLNFSKTYVRTIRPKTNNDDTSLKQKSKRVKGKDFLNSDMEIQESNVIYCKVCKKNIPCKPRKVSKHLKSLKHNEERRFLLVDNKISVSGSNYNLLHCDLCKIDFDEGTLHDHIINESHKTQVHLFLLNKR